MISGVKTVFYFQNQISIIRCSCHSLFQDVISTGRVSVLKLKISSRRRVLYKLLFSKRFSPIITVILSHIPGLVIPVAAVDTENKYGKGSNYRKKTETLLKYGLFLYTWSFFSFIELAMKYFLYERLQSFSVSVEFSWMSLVLRWTVIHLWNRLRRCVSKHTQPRFEALRCSYRFFSFLLYNS